MDGQKLQELRKEKTAQGPVTPREAWENLANAIIVQAAEDYREACRALRRRPENLDAMYMKAEVSRFLRRQDISRLTGVPGELI